MEFYVHPENEFVYTENNELLSAVGIYKNDIKNILLLERTMKNRKTDTLFSHPGGKVEGQDVVAGNIIKTLENGCIREGFEESGLIVKDLSFFDRYVPPIPSPKWGNIRIGVFNIHSYEGELLTFPTEEHISSRWFTYQDTQRDPLVGPVTKRMIQDLKEKHGL